MNELVRIAESKDQIGKITIPVGQRYKKDTWIDDAAYEEMIVAKSRLLRDFPFWGILGLQLVLVEDTSGYIPTLATDGRHIFYNAEFIMKLKRGERVFVVAHELYHCLFDHAGKGHRGTGFIGVHEGEKDPEKIKEANEKAQLWNFAVDFVVNDDLLQSKCGDFVTSIPILHDAKFRGMASEEVYQHLLDHPEDRPKGGSTLDVHIEIEIEEDGEEGDGEGGGSCDGGSGKDGKGRKKIKMKRSEYEKLRKQWADNAVKAAAAQKEAEARGGAGDIPAGIRRLLDDLMKPQFNWKQLLRRYVMSVMNRGYSFQTPNKALFNLGWTIPGFRTRKQQLDICVAVDTSGSVGDAELKKFISELDGILKSFGSYNVLAWCFESNIVEESITEITKANGKMEDVSKFLKNIGGGGGTNFECNYDFMKERKLKPRLFLMLTDGYPFGSWGDPRFCPSMFLLVGNPAGKAPFGITMHYEDAED